MMYGPSRSVTVFFFFFELLLLLHLPIQGESASLHHIPVQMHDCMKGEIV